MDIWQFFSGHTALCLKDKILKHLSMKNFNIPFGIFPVQNWLAESIVTRFGEIFKSWSIYLGFY